MDKVWGLCLVGGFFSLVGRSFFGVEFLVFVIVFSVLCVWTVLFRTVRRAGRDRMVVWMVWYSYTALFCSFVRRIFR